MSSIDKRIVEMEFDNQKFEKGVDSTINFLDRLKQSLNNVGTHNDQLKETLSSLNNVTLDTIAEGVSALQDRFSTFGIIGATVVQRLTNSVIDLGVGVAQTVSSLIKTKGLSRAFNIENARFMLQGLFSDDLSKVEQIMSQANESVLDTAYGYDEAAKAAAQFAASGVETGDDLAKALRAVTGVAATTNSEYEDIAHIFTTIAGNGKLMTMQLQQLSIKGMNAAAIMGKEMGYTEEQIRDMVTKGSISFNQFAEVMDNVFGKHAKEANSTFNGAMANMKAALGRIGADFYTPFIAQNSQLVKIINTVKGKINDLRKHITAPIINDFLSDFVFKSDGWLARINEAIKSIDIWKVNTVQLMGGFEKAGESINTVIDIICLFGNKVADVFDSVDKALHKSSENVKPFEERFRDFFTNVANGLKEFHEGMQKGFLTYDDKGFVTNEYNAFQVFLKVVRALKVAFELVVDAVKSFVEVFWGPIKEVAGSILEPILRLVGKIADKFSDWGENFINERGFVRIFTDFKDWLVKIGGVLKNLGDNVKFVFGKIYDIIRPVVEAIGGFFSSMWNSIREGFNDEYFDELGNTMDKVTDKFKPFTFLWEKLTQLWQALMEFVNNHVAPILSSVGKQIGDIFTMFWEPFLKGLKGEGWNTFIELMNGAALANLGTTMGVSLGNFMKIISEFNPLQVFREFGRATGVTGVMAKFKDVLFQYQTDLKADILIKIGQSIAWLAGSLFVLSSIDPIAMETAIAGIGQLMFFLSTMFATVTEISKLNAVQLGGLKWFQQITAIAEEFFRYQAIAMLFKTMAITILAIAGAIWALSGLNDQQIIRGLVVVTSVMMTMITMYYVMAKFPTDVGFFTGNMFTRMAFAILTITGALAIIANIEADKIKNGLVGLYGILGMFITVIALMFLVTKYLEKPELAFDYRATMRTVSRNLLAISTALVVAASALKIISTIDKDQMNKTLEALFAMIAGIVVILGAIAALDMFNNLGTLSFDVYKTMGKVSLFIFAFATEMVIIAAALKTMSTIDNGSMNTALNAFLNIFEAFLVLIAVVVGLDAYSKYFDVGDRIIVMLAAIEKAMLAFSATMVIISIAMSKMGSMSPEEMNTALIGLFGVLAAFVTLMAGVVILSEAVEKANMSKFALNMAAVMGAFSTMAWAINTISIGMRILGSMSMDKMQVALIGLFGALASIAVVLVALGKNNTGILKGSLAILAVSVAMNALVIPIMALSALKIEQVVTVMAAILGILAAFGVAAIVLAPFGAELLSLSLSILALGGAMLIVSAAIFLFASALTLLGAVGPVAVASFILVLMELAASIPLIVAAFIASLIPLLASIGAAIIEIGKQIIDIVLSLISELIVQLTKAATYILPELLNLLDVIVSQILPWLEERIGPFMQSVGMIVANALIGLKEAIGPIVVAICDLILTILEVVGDYFYENAEQIADALQGLLEGLIYAVAILLQRLWEWITDAIVSVLWDIFVQPWYDILGINSPSTEFAYIGQMCAEGLLKGLSIVLDGVREIAQGVIDIFRDVYEQAQRNGEQIYDALHGPITGEYTDEEKEKDDNARYLARQAYQSGDTSGLEANAKAGYYYNQLKANGGQFGRDIYNTGYEIGEEMVNGTNDALNNGIPATEDTGQRQAARYATIQRQYGIAQAKAATEEVGNAAVEGYQTADDKIVEVSDKQSLSYADTMKSHVSESKKSGEALATGGAKGTKSVSGLYTNYGNYDVSKFINSFTSDTNLEKAGDAGKTAGTEGAKGAKDASSEWVRSGHYDLEGLIQGLEDPGYLNRIYEKGHNAGNKALEGANDALKIESPSKKARETGRYFNAGLIQGLEETQGVIDASGNVASVILQSLSYAFDDVSQMTDALSVTPTITPVLDMNNVDTSMLSSMLNANKTMTMSGNLNVNDGRSSQSIISAINNLAKNGNRDVVDALNTLSGNVSQYNDSVRQMRIVMDSGTLVGEIGEAMDSQLGSIRYFRQRGMM